MSSRACRGTATLEPNRERDDRTPLQLARHPDAAGRSRSGRCRGDARRGLHRQRRRDRETARRPLRHRHGGGLLLDRIACRAAVRRVALYDARPCSAKTRNPRPVPASPRAYPTTIVLTNGATCVFLTGASLVVGDKRENYACTDGRALLGEPNRSAQPWRIDALKNDRARTPSLVDIAVAEY